MIINNDFLQNIGVGNTKADLEFTVLDTKSYEVLGTYNNKIPHNKSRGGIQTILEMHQLMSKSLSLVSPNLVFTSDFPDYLMAEDNPNYIKSVPMITPELYKSMPHFRWDLYKRNFENYENIENIPAPHITWGVVRTEPGTMSGQPFRGTQEIKPRQRDLVLVFNKEYKSVLDNNNSEYVEKNGKLYKFIKVMGQVFDNLVQYNIWTRSAWEAEELIEWFHKEYMMAYTGMFREAGINDMVFQRRVRDDTLMQMKNKYHLRSMLYYIRTEYITTSNIMPISRVDVNMDVLASTTDSIIDTNITDYYDQLIDNWHTKNNF